MGVLVGQEAVRAQQVPAFASEMIVASVCFPTLEYDPGQACKIAMKIKRPDSYDDAETIGSQYAFCLCMVL